MVQLESLTFAFKRSKPLFNGLNMKLERGNTYGLFGLNGAGKTTLLNLISGMLFPKSGICTINGTPVKERLPEVLSDLFILPEQFELPKMDALQYIDLFGPFYPRFDYATVMDTLADFQVEPAKNLTELSYGQKKKFLIAFALASRAGLLLMDEPTNGLDIPSKSQFRKVLAATDHSDRCVVISTHQVRDLDTLIDRITVLHGGSIIFDQTVHSIMEKLSFLRLEHGSSRDKLYHEEIPGGDAAICKREEPDRDTPVDLELLFNGVITQTENLNSVFENGGTA